MNSCEPPVLLHNMSAPPRTQVNTVLPALCPKGGGRRVPLFSLPHALVLAGHLQPDKGDGSAGNNWITNGGLISPCLWTEASQVSPRTVFRKWRSARSLMKFLRLKTVPPPPACLHFLIGNDMSRAVQSKYRSSNVPSQRSLVYRIVPDVPLTLAVLSRCCGGVLFGSREPDLEWSRLMDTALAFDDPVLRDLCFSPSQPITP
jgi:hypothetical protein